LAIDDKVEKIVAAILRLARRVESLEAADSVSVIIKTTTGNPATGKTTDILINTFDNKVFMYADGDWRQMATW